MLKFQTIASSSDGCCYLLQGGGASAPLLIEAGVSIKQIRAGLDAAGVGLMDLAGAVVSHRHLDHCRAAKDLNVACVDVWASQPTIEAVRSDRPHRMHELRAQSWAAIGDWQVWPFEIEHDVEGAFGLVVASPMGQRLLYLTDSCYTRYVIPGITHFAVECNHSEAILRANVEEGIIDGSRFARTSRTHMSLERLCGMLDAWDLSSARQIYLLHLSSTNSDASAFKQHIEGRYGIPCEVAPEVGAMVGGAR